MPTLSKCENTCYRIPLIIDIDDTYQIAILICMKTTLNIDDATLNKASKLTGISEKTALVRLGLEALIAKHSAERLAALGGSEPSAKQIPRRRPA